MAQSGLLTEVRWTYDGSELIDDTLAGTASLLVEDASSMQVDDEVFVEDTKYVITAVDTIVNTVTISPTLALDALSGTALVLSRAGAPSQSYTAVVVLPDSEEEIEVPLTTADLVYVSEGVYEPPAPVTVDDDLSRLLDMPGQQPLIPGGYIDVEGLPDLSTPSEPPASSPTPTIYSGSGVAVLTWDPVDKATAYALHIAPADGDGSAPDTPPDATTLVMTNASSPTWIDEMPDGTPLPFDRDTYFALVAYNSVDGAEPSPWVSGRPGQIVTAPLTASLAIVQEIISEIVQTAGIKIGTGSWTAVDGFSIPNVIDLPVDGSADKARLYANLIAKSLTVEGFLSLRGMTNTVEAAASLELSEGVTAPLKAATITSYWPVTGNLVNMDPSNILGMVRHSDTDYALLMQMSPGVVQIRRYQNGNLYAWSQTFSVSQVASGLIVAPDGRYTFVAKQSDGYYHLYQRSQPTGAGQFTAGSISTALQYSNLFTRRVCIQALNSTQYRIVGFNVNSFLVGVVYPYNSTQVAGDAYAWAGRASNTVYDIAAVMTNVGGSAGGTTVDHVFSTNGGNCESFFRNNAMTDGGITRASAYDFPVAYGRVPRASDGFYMVDSIGAVMKYRSNAITPHYVAYTWADLTAAGTGQHETLTAPRVLVSTGTNIVRGASVRATVTKRPVLPGNDDSPTDELVYVQTTTGTTFFLMGTADTLNAVQYEDPVFTGAQHGSRPAFPVTTPAIFRSSREDPNTAGEGLVHVKGDGAGRAGPFEWRSDGLRSRWGVSSPTTTAKSVPTAAWTWINNLPTFWFANGDNMPAPTSSYITIPVSGLYFFTFFGTWNNNAMTGRRILGLEAYTSQAVAAGDIFVFDETGGNSGAVYPSCSASVDKFLTAGQRVRLIGYQTNTGNAAVDLRAGAYITARRVG